MHVLPGLLEAPPDLSIERVDESFLQLTWDPPFTLDITNTNPDIMGYSICNDVTEECEFTPNTSYIYPDLGLPVVFSVSAVNVVGEGNASTVPHQECNPTSGKVDGAVQQ